MLVRRTIPILTLLVAACGSWSSEVRVRVEPLRAAIGDAHRVSVMGGRPDEPPGSLSTVGARHYGVAADLPALARAQDAIDWPSGAMSAAPFQYLAIIHLKASYSGDVDLDAKLGAIRRAVRAVGGNFGAVRDETIKTRRSHSSHGVVVIAYHLDCDALRQTRTSTTTN